MNQHANLVNEFRIAIANVLMQICMDLQIL